MRLKNLFVTFLLSQSFITNTSLSASPGKEKDSNEKDEKKLKRKSQIQPTNFDTNLPLPHSTISQISVSPSNILELAPISVSTSFTKTEKTPITQINRSPTPASEVSSNIPYLERMPQDIMSVIFSFLPLQSQISTAETSKRMLRLRSIYDRLELTYILNALSKIRSCVHQSNQIKKLTVKFHNDDYCLSKELQYTDGKDPVQKVKELKKNIFNTLVEQIQKGHLCYLQEIELSGLNLDTEDLKRFLDQLGIHLKCKLLKLKLKQECPNFSGYLEALSSAIKKRSSLQNIKTLNYQIETFISEEEAVSFKECFLLGFFQDLSVLKFKYCELNKESFTCLLEGLMAQKHCLKFLTIEPYLWSKEFIKEISEDSLMNAFHKLIELNLDLHFWKKYLNSNIIKLIKHIDLNNISQSKVLIKNLKYLSESSIKMETLNIKKCAQCNEIIKLFFKELKADKILNLKSLDLRGSRILDVDAEEIGKLFISIDLPKFEYLNLNRNLITSTGFNLFFDVINSEHLPNLKYLFLNRNSLCNSFLVKLSETIENNNLKNLVSLKIAKNEFTCLGIILLSKALSSNPLLNLKVLDLSNNSIYESGIDLFSAFKSGNYKQLTNLRLSMCNLSDDELVVLFECINEGFLPNLIELKLNGNTLYTVIASQALLNCFITRKLEKIQSMTLPNFGNSSLKGVSENFYNLKHELNLKNLSKNLEAEIRKAKCRNL